MFNAEKTKDIMLRIILANATIANSNRGCTALAITMLDILHKILLDAGVEYKIYLTDSHQQLGKEYTCHIGNDTIRYVSCGYPRSFNKIVDLKCIIKRLLLNNKDHNIFKNADFILDIGQGDSFSDIYGRSRFDSIDLVHKLSRKYRKPYCILPQTIGPFVNISIKKEADKSIEGADLCLVRDKQSYDYVINNTPSQTTVKEVTDVAFFMPFEKIVQDSNYTHVGLNVSALLWHGGYTCNNQFGLKCNYQQIMRSIIDYFLSQQNTKLHLIAHVAAEERNIENDYEICYELWLEYNNPNLVLAPFALGPIEIKSYIAGMNFFMGARMHSAIGAFSSGVPVVPMAYSRKFNGLFVDSLQYPYVVDMKMQSDKDVLTIIQQAFYNRNELSNVISDRMNGVVEERKQLLFSELKNFLNI